MRLFDHASTLGIRVGGLVSPSVFENGKKVGIHLVDLSTGERRPLAYHRGSSQGDLLTTDWQMDAETLEWGNSMLEKNLDCDLFILDELGPLEFSHGVGLVAGFEIIEARRDLPIFVSIRSSLIPEARMRWYWAQVLQIPSEAES
jgi:nucleoside-triphosphatase THEP1